MSRILLLGLALFALINHHGVGPFTGRVLHAREQPPSALAVSATVRNDGTKRSRANCRVVAFIQDTVESSDTLLTPPIDPGATIPLRDVLQGVNAPPTGVAVTCR